MEAAWRDLTALGASTVGTAPLPAQGCRQHFTWGSHQGDERPKPPSTHPDSPGKGWELGLDASRQLAPVLAQAAPQLCRCVAEQCPNPRGTQAAGDARLHRTQLLAQGAHSLRSAHRQLITTGSRSRIAPIRSPVPRSCAGRGGELRARQQRRYVMKQRGSDAAPSCILTASQGTGGSGRRRLWAGIPTPRAPAPRLRGGDGLGSEASRSAPRARRVPGRGRPWAATTELERGQAARCHPSGAARCDGVTPAGIARCSAPVSHRRHPSPPCHPPWSPGHGCNPRAQRPRIPAPPAPRWMRRHRPAAAVRGRAGPPLRSAPFAASSDHNSQQPGQEGPAPPPPAPRRAAQPAGPGPRTARPAPPSAAAAPAPRRAPALPHRNPRTAPPGAPGLRQAGMGGVPTETGLQQSGCREDGWGSRPRGSCRRCRRAGARRRSGVKLRGCGRLGWRQCRLQGYRALGRQQAGCRSRCSPMLWVSGMKAAWGAGGAALRHHWGHGSRGGAQPPGLTASSAPAVSRVPRSVSDNGTAAGAAQQSTPSSCSCQPERVGTAPLQKFLFSTELERFHASALWKRAALGCRGGHRGCPLLTLKCWGRNSLS